MKNNFKNIGLYVLTIWGIFFISRVLPINNFGIVPRSGLGLIGIITAPFLHANIQHIISNTAAIIIFAPIFALVEGEKSFQKVGAMIILTGLLTWLVARPAVHIGASGLIFALYGYLISFSFFKKKFLYLILSLFLVSGYGCMLFGVLPQSGGISWESHLAGLVSGMVMAKYY